MFDKINEIIIRMILFKFHSCLLLFLILLTTVCAQSNLYTGYQTSFSYVTSCLPTHYYDVALLQCAPCPAGAQQKINGSFQKIKIVTRIEIIF